MDWLRENWKKVAVVGCLGAMVFAVGCPIACITLVMKGMKSSDAYVMAMERIRASDAARQALGEPISDGFLVSGKVNVSGGSGEADLSIPVSGPKGSGTLYVNARKAAGQWEFQRLDLDAGGKRVSLLAGERRTGDGSAEGQ